MPQKVEHCKHDPLNLTDTPVVEGLTSSGSKDKLQEKPKEKKPEDAVECIYYLETPM